MRGSDAVCWSFFLPSAAPAYCAVDWRPGSAFLHLYCGENNRPRLLYCIIISPWCWFNKRDMQSLLLFIVHVSVSIYVCICTRSIHYRHRRPYNPTQQHRSERDTGDPALPGQSQPWQHPSPDTHFPAQPRRHPHQLLHHHRGLTRVWAEPGPGSWLWELWVSRHSEGQEQSQL